MKKEGDATGKRTLGVETLLTRHPEDTYKITGKKDQLHYRKITDWQLKPIFFNKKKNRKRLRRTFKKKKHLRATGSDTTEGNNLPDPSDPSLQSCQHLGTGVT